MVWLICSPSRLREADLGFTRRSLALSSFYFIPPRIDHAHTDRHVSCLRAMEVPSRLKLTATAIHASLTSRISYSDCAEKNHEVVNAFWVSSTASPASIRNRNILNLNAEISISSSKLLRLTCLNRAEMCARNSRMSLSERSTKIHRRVACSNPSVSGLAVVITYGPLRSDSRQGRPGFAMASQNKFHTFLASSKL